MCRTCTRTSTSRTQSSKWSRRRRLLGASDLGAPICNLRPMRRALYAASALLVLAACGGSDLSKFSTPAELRSDLIAAGVPCAQLEDIADPGNGVLWAASCESIDHDLMLIIYPDRKTLRQSIEHVCSDSTPSLGVVGENWVVVGFSSQADSVARALSGKTC